MAILDLQGNNLTTNNTNYQNIQVTNGSIVSIGGSDLGGNSGIQFLTGVGTEVFLDDPVSNTTYNITDRVISINTTRRLGREGSTFNLVCKNIELRHEFNKIRILIDGTAFMTGIVINQTDADKGYKQTRFSCVDNLFLLNRRIVSEIYKSTDPSQGQVSNIIKTIITNHVPELTSNSVDDINVTIGDQIEFPYVTADNALNRLSNLNSEIRYYVDAENDFHMFLTSQRDGIEFSLDNGRILNRTLAVEYSAEQTVNSVRVVGAKRFSDEAIENNFVADGIQRYFRLSNIGSNLVITLDGVPMSYATESNNNGTEDFLFNRNEKYIVIPENIATPFTGDLVVTYNAQQQIIAKNTNPASIRNYGLFEKVIKDKDISDNIDARRISRAEVNRRSNFARTVRFQTSERVNLGDRCTIDIVDSVWDIQGSFVVTSIADRIDPDSEVSDFMISRIELEELL